MRMNGKQYNNVINWTLRHNAEENDALGTARKIFKNMGVALPHGDCGEVLGTLKTDDYMGWRSCTMEEAQEAANDGEASIGISGDRIVVLAADTSAVVSDDAVMAITEETPAQAISNLQFMTYSALTTSSGTGGTSTSYPYSNKMKSKYLLNENLWNYQNIPPWSRAKAVYSAGDCLSTILKYEAKIVNTANMFLLPADMIRAVLYREMLCYGRDDILADNLVRDYYEKGIGVSDSSTGLAQIFASTALKAEDHCYKKRVHASLWPMWQALQDNDTNIHYCGMVLRMEADNLSYTGPIAPYDLKKVRDTLAGYNNSDSYGDQVLDNYKEFLGCE